MTRMGALVVLLCASFGAVALTPGFATPGFATPLVLPDFEESGSEELDSEDAEPEVELTRDERFDALFAELAAAATDEDAAFIAEEIEALWRDSGSATVDLLTDRATDALEDGDAALARQLINGALELAPEHAEAWSQSARIAAVDDDLRMALEHIERAVSLEVRHYDAFIVLGSILERLNADAGAHEAYQNALDLNPRLPRARDGAERTARAARGRDL